ncbi:AIDA repeat-containing protein [Escherichia coli O28/42:H37]|uniref:AIDA repeat-containing protein n=1 Tax=Escherichia coli TaxID=562 RepID=UPI0014086CCD|nr:AIDA repeat-containing protein [Escherichia coli]EFN9393885.1 autotransporter outer membrane beta-barrel domain-containing protein [Escherichia coli]EGK3856220.1 autotransporter outer membrane beta-barrel domain-containing protein [Escherichia coli]MDC9064491.1 AIDA repeat-containing protein [Escherichia coli]MDC9095997.1 AIDA repeat-containing protein [Escherichia coli]NHQ96386.1 autotransporter outer membrane beta-barrel domain-containing protein [Escherichia coli]
MNRTSPYYCRRSVLSLLISALIYAPPGMAAFTTNVIGVVNDETVDGNQKVDERGTTNNTHIINHGQQNVHGGVSNGSLIESGGYQDIGSHNNFVGQANNTTINGGRQSIHDGGISTGTTIESGNQDVYKGGISNGTTIKGGASRVEGGSANGILIDGGSQIVKVQGHADGTTINKSGSQDVVQGSLATNTTINGGRQYVEQSTVETTTIKNGGEQRVYESRALDTTIEGGTQSLNSKSTAKNTHIYSGGTQIVDNTSTSDVIEVYSGGVLDVSGGTATNVTQHDGAILKTNTNGTTVSGTNSEGAFSIHNHVADNVLLENGGHLDINAYGSANKTIIKDKGTMSVLTNAKADATRIDNGGVMDVAGNATNTIINGGTQNINNYGIATGTNINSGTQNIKSGGKADTTIISSGSRQVVEKDGTAIGSNISAGGSLIVYTGGIAHGVNQETGSALVANTGAGTDIEGYNKLSHFTITGGEANYVVLENTGELTVVAKTSAKNTTIDTGGKLIVQKEAKTDSTRLNNGGVLEVQDGGEAKHVEQQSGGALIASTTSGTLIEGTNSYGDAFYIRNSEAKNVVLENAGSLTVVTGSRAVDTIINANGKMDVYGKDVGTVLNSAGTQTIYASATSDKANIKGGKQTVYGLATEANIESGEQIVDGGSTEKTHINGGTQTVQNYGKAINTDIVSGLQQIMANGTAEGSIINGGSQVVNEGGLAENSVLNDGGTLDVREKGSATGIQQSSQGALVATTRATRVTGTRADGVAFSIEQGAANNILLANGGVLTVESDTSSAGFEQTLTGMTVGIDSRNDIPEGITTLGAFMGYSHSHIGFDRGGHGSVGSYSLGGYASWEHESGFYLDGVVKLNRFKSNVAGKMSSGGAANGSYHSNGLGGHIETGMRFTDGNWNLTPYASLTGFTADNPEYHLSNGMKSKSVDTRSIYRELGATLSYNMRLGNGMEVEPWLKAAVRKEFVDDNRVKVNSDGNFVNYLSGRRGIYQAGIKASFSSTLSGHLGVGYSHSAGVESPWNAVAGVNWSF